MMSRYFSDLSLKEPKVGELSKPVVVEVGDSRVQYPEGFPVYSPHRYLLELMSKGQVEDSITLFYVSAIQMSQPHALDRKWTFGTVYEQSTSFRERTFSISGRTGDQPLDINRFLKMRNFIESYADKKRKTENAYTNNKVYRLRLRATWECEYFEASILSFSYQREAGNHTNSYTWNLVLATNQYVEKKALPTLEAEAARRAARLAARNATLDAKATEDEAKADTANASIATALDGGGYRTDNNFSAELIAEAKEMGIPPDELRRRQRQTERTRLQTLAIEKRIEAYQAEIGKSAPPGAPNARTSSVLGAIATVTGTSSRTSSNWFDDLTASFATLEKKATEATAYVVGLSLKPAAIYRKTVTPFISLLSTTANSAAAMVGAVHGSLPAVRREVILTVEAARRAADSFEQAWAGLQDLTSEEYWSNLVAPVWSNRRPQMSVAVNNVYQPVVAHPAPSGNSGGGGTGTQDAYNLAWIFLGNRGRWLEIVEANSFLDPYTKADGTPIKVGDLILVPDPDGVPAKFTSTAFYGSDLKVKDGDLVMRGSSGLQTVSGEDNLRQNLSHRLKTVRGTNRAFPSFGLEKFLNERQLSTLVAQVWSSVLAQVSADRRIGDVVRLVIEEQPSVYKIGLSFRSASQANLTFSFEYSPE